MIQLPLHIDYSDKVVVITGAGGLICSAMVRAFARSGAKVAALDLNEEAVTGLAAELTDAGFICKGYKADVLDGTLLETVHRQVLSDLGPCDILLNGAGGNNPRGTTDKEYLFPEDLENSKEAEDIKTFFDLDPKGVSFVFDLNFMGVLLPTQVFAREMIGREAPTIINISSMNAFRPLTKIPAYSGAKAAVSNFTQWLAVHFSKVGIRVNAIAPGFFVTNQNRGLLMNEDGSLTPRSEKILAATPMGRFGEVEDLRGPLLFLCDADASAFVNGVVLPVDGGFAAYSGV